MLNLWSILLRSDQQTLLTLYAVDTVEDWLKAWPAKTGNELMVHVWRFLPYVVLWTIWKNMNRKVFDEVEVQITKMEREVKALAWYWCGIWAGRKKYRFRDLSTNWDGVLTGMVMRSQVATGTVVGLLPATGIG
ncbi:hypothetical protein FRX31_016288 [Thalictrum thalictroides]|uniref:Uncharacterized protein n=1 Tax=Thalictrum thalictroides TaxID=46969 RepID=A0A7J6WAX9_THATH|nr:hypothetical protein FRX31_016288 [Thalictrum thalictroides]